MLIINEALHQGQHSHRGRFELFSSFPKKDSAIAWHPNMMHNKKPSMVICGIFVLVVFFCIPFFVGLNINYTVIYYCATIAYHVELNGYLGGRRRPANVQEKWTHNSGEMPWNRGDPTSDVAFDFLFSSWPGIWNQRLLLQGNKIIFFLWMYLSFDTETSCFSFFILQHRILFCDSSQIR